MPYVSWTAFELKEWMYHDYDPYDWRAMKLSILNLESLKDT